MIPQAIGFIGGLKVKVGTFYQGGIVVYIDRGARRGLIAQNQYTTDGLAFGPNGAFTQTAGYGFGFVNTQNAFNALSPASNTALNTAWNSTLNGYSDWFLPTRAEAVYVYQARAFLPFWTGGTLWLSEYVTGTGDANAYTQDYNGTVTTYTRSETGNRRSIACRYMNFT